MKKTPHFEDKQSPNGYSQQSIPKVISFGQNQNTFENGEGSRIQNSNLQNNVSLHYSNPSVHVRPSSSNAKVDTFFQEIYKPKPSANPTSNIYSKIEPPMQAQPPVQIYGQPIRPVEQSVNEPKQANFNPLKVQFSPEGMPTDVNTQQAPQARRETNDSGKQETKRVDVSEQSLVNLKAQMKSLLSDLEKLQVENQKMKITNQSLIKDLEFMKNERQKLENQLNNKHEDKDMVYQKQIADLNKIVSQLNAQNKLLSDKATESVNASRGIREQNFDLENKNFELKSRLTELENTLGNVGVKAKYYSKSEQSLNEMIAKLKTELAEMKERKFEVEQKLAVFQRDSGNGQSQQSLIQQLEQSLMSVKQSLAHCEDNLNRTSSELHDKLYKNQELEYQVQQLNDEVEMLQKERSQMRQKLEESQVKSVPKEKAEAIRAQTEALQRELQLNQAQLMETRNVESVLRQNYNELRAKYQAEISNKQKFNQTKLIEFDSQTSRMQERIDHLEEQLQVVNIELENANKAVEKFQTDRQTHMKIKLGLESKVSQLESSKKGLEEELLKMEQRIEELTEVAKVEERNKGDIDKVVNDLRSDNAKLKKEVIELKSKMLLSASRPKSVNENNSVTTSFVSANESVIGDGEQALHRDCRRKIRTLQNDYVTLQIENNKLRDDVYQLREDRMAMLDRSMRSSSVVLGKREEKNESLNQQLLNILEKGNKKEEKSDRKRDELPGFNQPVNARTRAFAENEGQLGDHKRGGVGENASRWDEQTINAKKELIEIVKKWNPMKKRLEECSLLEIVKQIGEIFDEMGIKLEELRSMNEYLERANQMIAKLESEKKVLLEELKDSESSSY